MNRAVQTLQSKLAARLTRETGVLMGLAALIGIAVVTRPDVFFDWDSMSATTVRLLRTSSPYILIGVPMTYLIISGEFDLSVGSLYAVCGLLLAVLVGDFHLPIALAVVLVLLAGATVGATNAVLVTRIGVPSLIVTIGMLSVLRGVAYYLTPGGSRSVDSTGVLQLLGGQHEVVGIVVPYQVYWALFAVILFSLVLQHTTFGYHVYATGDDETSAQKSGIDTDRVKTINFVLVGLLTALAGMAGIAYFGSMFGTSGQQYELYVIAGVIIGGTNLFGGEGKVYGTLVGVLIIGIIPILLVLNGVSVEIDELLTGIIIVSVLVLDIVLREEST